MPGPAHVSSFVRPGRFGRHRHRDLLFLLLLLAAFVVGAWCLPPLAFGAAPVLEPPSPSTTELVNALSLYRTMVVVQLFVGIGSGVFGMYGVVMAGRARRETQRREVTFTAEYLTKGEAGAASEEVDRRITQLEDALRTVQAEWRADRAALDRVNEERLVRLHTRLDQVEKELQAQISNMPAQLIAMLKNTGAIK